MIGAANIRNSNTKLLNYTWQKIFRLPLTLFTPGFFGWCSTGGVFHLHPVTPLSLKSDNSNFVQNYFGVRSNILRQEKSGPHR